MNIVKALIIIVSIVSIGLSVSFARGQTVPTSGGSTKAELESSPIHGAHVYYPSGVLELFTSQGCSSCPKANEFVRKVSAETDVLTLSYSVDYWDYLGWKDTFGKPEFAARQRKYGKQFQGQVYTPQLILNGASHAASFSKENIHQFSLRKLGKPIQITDQDDTLKVSLPIGAFTQSVSIMAVRYKIGEQAIPVARGENSGRIIKLANVVTSCRKIGHAKPKSGFSKTVKPLAVGEALAILVQQYDGGPVLSAAIYKT